eukprot:scaffold43289_cov16-Tisochrysis_lutea.AAC.1
MQPSGYPSIQQGAGHGQGCDAACLAPRLPRLDDIIIRARATEMVDGVGQKRQGEDAEDEDREQAARLRVVSHGTRSLSKESPPFPWPLSSSKPTFHLFSFPDCPILLGQKPDHILLNSTHFIHKPSENRN